MPSSYQRIFEYYKVGECELMLAEIIPYKIPVLYKGSTINTYKWMNFNSWHEIYSHLDEIVHDYSEKSTNRNMQYVKGVSVVIGYQFESADPHAQMFPLLSSGNFSHSDEKEKVVEFKMCSIKLVASIYPLQFNCPEIELPYYFVRNYDILKGLLEKDVRKRIYLSKLNQERRKRLTSNEILTSPRSKSDKLEGRNNESESPISKSSIFDLSSELTSSSKIFSSSPASGNRDFDGKVEKKNSFNKTFEDDYNNLSKNPDDLKRKNDDSDENDFKIVSGKKKRKRRSPKEKKEISSSRRNNKSVNKSESKKKKNSEEIKKCKNNESERQQPKITTFLRSSCISSFDADSTPDNDHSCSFNSITKKTESGVISNSLKEEKNNLNSKRHVNKVVQKENNDENLNNDKESVNIGINFSDTLPDLLCGYGEQSQGSDIKSTSSVNEVIPEVSKDGKSGNADSFNIGIDSCDILPDLNVYSENSKENEINDISLHVNESPLLTSRSKFLKLFSFTETTSSLVEPLEPEGETSVEKQSSSNESKLFEVSRNILNFSSNNFTNDTWTDSLPDLTQCIATKNLNGSFLTLGSTEISQCFTKTRNKTIKSPSAYVKRSKKRTTKEKKNITSKHKYKNNTKEKKLSKKPTCRKRSQKSSIDSLNISSSSCSSIGVKISKRNKCTGKNSTLSSNESEVNITLSHGTIRDKSKVEDTLEDHSSSDNCEDNLVKRVYNDLRKLTIDDFEYHLEKHSSYLKDIILGKIPNDRDKKLFRGCHLPIDMSSELFVHVLDDNIVYRLMDMCMVNFSSVMNSSGRNIQVVLYNMLVIIPELLKKVLLSLPCAKENNFTETDCEQIFFQLTTCIDESE